CGLAADHSAQINRKNEPAFCPAGRLGLCEKLRAQMERRRAKESGQSESDPAVDRATCLPWRKKDAGPRAIESREKNRTRMAFARTAQLNQLAPADLRFPSHHFTALLRFDHRLSKGIERDVAGEELFDDRAENKNSESFKCGLIEEERNLQTPREGYGSRYLNTPDYWPAFSRANAFDLFAHDGICAVDI